VAELVMDLEFIKHLYALYEDAVERRMFDTATLYSKVLLKHERDIFEKDKQLRGPRR
jgi:hypothetical protein